MLPSLQVWVRWAGEGGGQGSLPLLGVGGPCETHVCGRSFVGGRAHAGAGVWGTGWKCMRAAVVVDAAQPAAFHCCTCLCKASSRQRYARAFMCCWHACRAWRKEEAGETGGGGGAVADSTVVSPKCARANGPLPAP
eukprot:350494-Chlamydomonas_euryale.AAC.22